MLNLLFHKRPLQYRRLSNSKWYSKTYIKSFWHVPAFNSLRPSEAYMRRVSRLTIIGSDNGLSPGWRQAIIWTRAGILLIGPLGINFSENLIEIYTFLFRKCIWECRLENGGHFVSVWMYKICCNNCAIYCSTSYFQNDLHELIAKRRKAELEIMETSRYLVTLVDKQNIIQQS